MFLFYGIGLSLVIGGIAGHIRSIVKHSYKSELIGDPDVPLEKRSAQIIGSSVLTGMRAVRNLLTGATKIQSNTPTRQFIKSGGYERALKDFREAAPKNIQTFETEFKTVGRTGDVGNKQLILRYNGEERYSTLEIRELETSPFGRNVVIAGKTTDKINYPQKILYVPKNRL